MTYEDLILEKEDSFAILTLNRPEKLNAVTVEMREQLQKVVEEVRNDDEINVLIITGAGRGFCSGADLSATAAQLASGGQIPRWLRLDPAWGWLRALRELNKPTIAAVNGIAAGVGFSLALMCDIIFASEQARFSAIWVKRALVPDGGATYLLPRIVGTGKALELMLTGDIIDAKEAERLGLVNRIVPHQDLMKEAKELAKKLAKGPPIAIELTKRGVYNALQNNLEQQVDFENYAQAICLGSEDFMEGATAFLQKREPVFRGI